MRRGLAGGKLVDLFVGEVAVGVDDDLMVERGSGVGVVMVCAT